MNTFLSVIPIVARRVRANVRLLTAVVIGAVLAAALMSTTSIYTNAIRDLGLSFALREKGPDKLNVLVRSTSQLSRDDIYRKNKEFIDNAERGALGPLLTGQTWAARSATFFPTAPGAAVDPDEGRRRSHLQFMTEMDAHIRIVEGALPVATTSGDRAPSIEVAMGASTARRLGINLGDRFDLHPFWRPEAAPVRAIMVGLIEPIDPRETYWLGQTDFFDFPSQRWETLPFFVAEGTYFDAVTNYLPTMSSDFWSMAYLNAKKIDARNAERVRSSVENLERQLAGNIERTATVTELPAVLKAFHDKLFFTRIPLLVLVLQIAGIVLYYLFMVSTMLVERQSSEIALLKSRGATTAQVMQIYVIEGLAIMVLALAAGPPLAALAISLLGKTPSFRDLSEGAYLSVRLSGGAYFWALSGALLAYATLLWPAYQATRKTVVQYKTQSARPPKQPAFTRYYLDLALVGLGALLFYQLNRRGSLVTEKLFGEQSADPISLMTPAFFILTVGIVFLRLFPLALRAATWAVARAQGTAVLIGMWQLVRNPLHYSRLVLLLMLATAVGMFAASFGATVNQSYEDRAAYQSGSELRLQGIRRFEAPGPTEFPATARSRLGADAVSVAFRADGSQGIGFQRTGFHLLGIDPATFGQVAFFRGDFSNQSLDSILETLGKDSEATPGIELPADSRWAGLWVKPVELNGRVGFDLKVRDAAGRYFTYILGPDGGSELLPGWSFIVADLTRPQPGAAGFFGEAPPRAPLTVQSISIRFISRVSALSGSVQFDDLQTSATASLTPGLPVERLLNDPERHFAGLTGARVSADFEKINAWEILGGLVAEPLRDELRQAPSNAGGFAVQVDWRPVPGQPVTHGLRVRGEGRPLAVFASEAFVRETGLGPGARTNLYVTGTYVEVEIAGTFKLFPTLAASRDDPALVANVDRLMTALNRNPRSTTTYADEIWIKSGAETDARVSEAFQGNKLIATAFNLNELRQAQKKDPLVAAGWEGILFLSFAAILILSAIGFLIYSYLTAQKRTLEFAVLRTMGFSRLQIAAVVGFEQVFVIGLGMLAGSLMGLRLGRLMIRYMGVTETGDSVLPPMLLHVSWSTAATALAILAAAFLVTIGIVVLLYSRLALHRVLRIGET